MHGSDISNFLQQHQYTIVNEFHAKNKTTKLPDFLFLGERHLRFNQDEDNDRRNNSALISAFYHPNDIVLAETPSDESIDPAIHEQTQWISRHITVKGWEDPQSSKILKEISHLVFKQIFPCLESIAKANEEMKRQVNMKISQKDLHNLELYLNQLGGQQLFSDSIEVLKNADEKMIDISAPIAQIAHCSFQKIQDTLAATYLPRTENLLKTIEENQMQRLFILAGEKHLIQKSDSIPEQIKALHRLHRYLELSSKTSAIYIPHKVEDLSVKLEIKNRI
jgi:hypothetical protein